MNLENFFLFLTRSISVFPDMLERLKMNPHLHMCVNIIKNETFPFHPFSRRQDFSVQISICLFYHQIIPPFQHTGREAPKEQFFNKHFEPLKMMRAMFINEICPFNEQWNPFSEKELQAVWQNFKAPLYFILFYRLISNKNQPLFWISQEEPKKFPQICQTM